MSQVPAKRPAPDKGSKALVNPASMTAWQKMTALESRLGKTVLSEKRTWNHPISYWEDDMVQFALSNREKLLKAYGFVEGLTLGATTREIGEQIEGLQIFCFRDERSPHQHKMWVDGWAESLEGYPLELITEACRWWRELPSKGQHKSMPTPGHLIQRMRERRNPVTSIRFRLKSVVKFLNDNPDMKPLSSDPAEVEARAKMVEKVKETARPVAKHIARKHDENEK